MKLQHISFFFEQLSLPSLGKALKRKTKAQIAYQCCVNKEDPENIDSPQSLLVLANTIAYILPLAI